MSTITISAEMQKAEAILQEAQRLPDYCQRYIADTLIRSAKPFDPMNYTTEELNIELVRRWEDYKTGRDPGIDAQEFLTQLQARIDARKAS